ncbi:hypothetical protein [Tenggerimyces flavus]|uniref:Uncharacterized protein n=1 Tax=Tenggerimyces flavus TaxID=1708749 RepID=A0ABV7Y6W4_9ACTN|nr:hypothetical protein [Tenggerimyces flavus]MBM7788685.1 hypothetical protein [Tenggerimyces flavus]
MSDLMMCDLAGITVVRETTAEHLPARCCCRWREREGTYYDGVDDAGEPFTDYVLRSQRQICPVHGWPAGELPPPFQPGHI